MQHDHNTWILWFDGQSTRFMLRSVTSHRQRAKSIGITLIYIDTGRRPTFHTFPHLTLSGGVWKTALIRPPGMLIIILIA